MATRTQWRALGLAAVLTVMGGLAWSQQSSVGGLPSRPRFQSMGVGAAAPAAGNVTASGTVTAANYVGNVGGVAPSDFARLSQENAFAGVISAPSALLVRGTTASAGTMYSYVSLQTSAGIESGWMGFNADGVVHISNVAGNVSLNSSGGSVLANGSAVCTANGANCPAGAALRSARGQFAGTGSTCNTIGQSGVSACTRSSTGIYSMTLNAGYTVAPECTVSPRISGTPAFAPRSQANSTTQVDVQLYSQGGTLMDGGFVLSCIGT